MPADSSPNIFNLADILFSLPDERQMRFGRIFHLSSTVGQAVPPEAMQDWITQHFGGVEVIEDQYVIKVTNQVTMEGALFNEVRSLWSPEPLSAEQVAEVVEAEGDDPFCDPETLTPADTFPQGRVRSQYCVTASSLVKLDGYHGLVVFQEHNPLRFTQDQLNDYLDVAWRWAELAHQEDPQARYYLVIWNCLPRAAATVVHGHLQMLLTRDVHYPRIEAWRRAAETYRQTYGEDYFNDVFEVHADLGLGFVSQGARVMASLTPVKECEILIMGDVDDYARPGAFSEPFKRALFKALDTFINHMGVTAFNLAIYCPPLGETSEAWRGFPIIARLVDRGHPGGRVSDVGAMELFAASVVRTDPFRVADALREAFRYEV